MNLIIVVLNHVEKQNFILLLEVGNCHVAVLCNESTNCLAIACLLLTTSKVFIKSCDH